MKPEPKPKKVNPEHNRAGLSREFIEKVSEELQAIRKDKREHR
jgi:hypothetical protein